MLGVIGTKINPSFYSFRNTKTSDNNIGLKLQGLKTDIVSFSAHKDLEDPVVTGYNNLLQGLKEIEQGLEQLQHAYYDKYQEHYNSELSTHEVIYGKINGEDAQVAERIRQNALNKMNFYDREFVTSYEAESKQLKDQLSAQFNKIEKFESDNADNEGIQCRVISGNPLQDVGDFLRRIARKNAKLCDDGKDILMRRISNSTSNNLLTAILENYAHKDVPLFSKEELLTIISKTQVSDITKGVAEAFKVLDKLTYYDAKTKSDIISGLLSKGIIQPGQDDTGVLTRLYWDRLPKKEV